ncbi:uncharacterized protein LOC117221488 isoform X2 [Megalopta genalis]|uniref:uncharacterized protein LOC117221488 isoform X2 n=1 Tax=Megalopta genalis TaxID=115081 RepID=UPI003FD643C8
MPSTETTSLTGDKPARVYYVRDSYPFHSHRRRQKLQLRCVVYTIATAIFTMALIVTVSYSVNHDLIDNSPNLSTSTSPQFPNLTLSLGFSHPASPPASNSVELGGKRSTVLTVDEYKEGLEAGRQAITERLFADAAALTSPLPSPSPASRHRYAVSTCRSVRSLALVAVGELAATRKIESARSILGETSAVGSYFDGGWVAQGVCKYLTEPDCPSNKYRTFDGSCNRQMQQGATMTPFRRVLPANYADGLEAPRRSTTGEELPSAREVSLKVHKPAPSTNPRFTVILAVYGQFLDHDITATAISQGINGSSIACCPPSVGHPECFPVPVASGDPVFDVTGTTCMEFVRSAPAPQCKLGPRQQLNQITAFIDGSAIYGSDIGAARSLRSFSGGRLRMQTTPDNRTLLPASTNPNDGCNRETEKLRGRYCFAAGDARANENLHLTTMHLLWARQHNKVADRLAGINPGWDDETLYQETRRIIGAQMQHVTYEEFLPIVLGETEVTARGLRPLKSGYRISDPRDSELDPTIANSFAAAAFRFAHTLLPGLMRMTDDLRGSSSYVELHRMLFNPYSLYAQDGVKRSVASATENVIQMTSTHVTSQLTNHLFEDPIGNVTLPCGLDLVSLNVQRGRDHGLPGYTQWREHCGLGKVDSFSDLEGHLDPQTLQDISGLYKSVHDVDLYTGALAELPKSDGIVGPTFNCLIADQFVRLQRGDRFWYESPDQPYPFTEDQLQELRKTSLARLICDCSDGVSQIQAEVMRTIDPSNPMLSCEDIPRPAFDAWRADRMKTPVLGAAFMPFNWTAFKDSINSTVKDVVTYINDTRATATVDTDWVAFRNYINKSFSDLRNQVSALHPRESAASSSAPLENSSEYPNSFILQAAGGPPDVYQDWAKFKSDLAKSLNESIASMSNGPAAAAKWIAFKQDIADRFADLKTQVASMKADLAPKTLAKVSEEMIFDWKNYKDDITASLNDTIMDIEKNMPPPGDPAWAAYGADIRDKFFAFRDKVNGQRPLKELAARGEASDEDWLSYKADIKKTIDDAVKNIKDRMPPPGDPAWAAYRDEVIKNFSAFRTTPPPPLLFSAKDPKRGALGSATFNNSQLPNLTNDWIEFRARINDSLARIIQDIRSKRPTTHDPVGWAAFKQSVANDFAKFRDEIASMKAELAAKYDELRTGKDAPSLRAAAKGGSTSKFDYTKFIRPYVPPEDWIAFKQQINDTLTSLLNRANATDETDFDEVHEMFDKSFADLKTEIASLKSLIALSRGNKTADWSSFQKQLNSTVQELADSVGDESKASAANVLRALFQTEDKLAGLQPPDGAPPKEWKWFSSKINQTLSDTLNVISDKKLLALTLRAEASDASSSDRPLSQWLMIPCLMTVLLSKVKLFVC